MSSSGYAASDVPLFGMSPRAILLVQFAGCIVLCIFFGAWLLLTFQTYLYDELTTGWIAVSVFFAIAVAFDVYMLARKLGSAPL